MELFNSLKNLIIADDAPTSQVLKPATQPLQATPVAIDPNTSSVLDVASVEATIDGLIQSNKIFDQFASFNKVVTSMKDVIADEATRFKAAAATTGIPKDALLASVNGFQQILENEKSNFEASFVANCEAGIASVNAEAEQLAQQIADLTTKLGEMSDKKNDLAKDAVTKTAELAKAKIDFASVVQSIEKRYTETADKLQKFLGA